MKREGKGGEIFAARSATEVLGTKYFGPGLLPLVRRYAEDCAHVHTRSKATLQERAPHNKDIFSALSGWPCVIASQGLESCMARITVEDCLDHVKSRFELVQLASIRARQLIKGAKPCIDSDNREIVVALREIAANKVRWVAPKP